jgi:hypothetical protein
MRPRPPYMENPNKYEIANEVFSSAIKILQTAGFYEEEVLELFAEVSRKRPRAPLYLDKLPI